MMAMLMSSGSGGVSEEFLTSIKEALQSGGNKNPIHLDINIKFFGEAF